MSTNKRSSKAVVYTSEHNSLLLRCFLKGEDRKRIGCPYYNCWGRVIEGKTEEISMFQSLVSGIRAKVADFCCNRQTSTITSRTRVAEQSLKGTRTPSWVNGVSV